MFISSVCVRWFIDIAVSKHFYGRRLRFQLLKFASPDVEMFENTLFSFCCPFIGHSCHKKAIPVKRFSFHQLFFQSRAAFSLFTAFFFNISTKMSPFSYSKHFYDRGLRFQQMNVQSTVVDLISTCFMPHLRVNCKIELPIIYKLTHLETWK